MVSLVQITASIAKFLSGAEDAIDNSTTASKTGEDQHVFLVVYGSYGPLPSFDPDCLIAIVTLYFLAFLNFQCWLRICGAKFVIEDSNEPEMSPNGIGETVTKENIREFVIDRKFKNHSDNDMILSYCLKLLVDTIFPAILGCLWLEEPMDERTKQNYARNYPWPVGEYLVWRRRRRVQCEILSRKCDLVQLKSGALNGLRNLSDFLGSKEYFSGPKPGYDDAVAYGLLAIPLILFNPTHELRTMIETCSNLRAFVSRMRKQLFGK